MKTYRVTIESNSPTLEYKGDFIEMSEKQEQYQYLEIYPIVVMN